MVGLQHPGLMGLADQFEERPQALRIVQVRDACGSPTILGRLTRKRRQPGAATTGRIRMDLRQH